MHVRIGKSHTCVLFRDDGKCTQYTADIVIGAGHGPTDLVLAGLQSTLGSIEVVNSETALVSAPDLHYIGGTLNIHVGSPSSPFFLL